MKLPTNVRRYLLAILGIVAVIGFWKVGMRAWVETWGGFHGDVAIYMTVARGVTQGLVPYVDLFENKAPGVFLLGALSIALFDGPLLLSWLQGVVIALFPFALLLPLVMLYGWRRAHALPYLIVLLIGCVFALYVGDMAGQLLPESYGAFLATLFLGLAYASGERAWTSKKIGLALVALLLLSVGIKEPFAVSIVGATVLLMPWNFSRRVLLRSFVGAGVIGLVVLLLLGWTSAYVTVHLAHMLGFHVFHPWGTVGEPWWLRFHDLPRIWENLTAYSPFLPWLIVVLWLGALAVMLHEAKTLCERRRVVLRWLIATWLNTFTVGLTGDFYSHHFIFAMPLYVACVWICTRGCLHAFPRGVRSAGVLVAALLAAIMLIKAPSDYRYIYTTWQEWAMPRRFAAETLDTVMDRCAVDRYFLLIDRPDGFYGFPKHLPYGPIFTQYGRFIGALPAYVDAYSDAFSTAKIMVLKTREDAVPMNDETWAIMQSVFTETPPPCAGSFIQPLPYHILFRRS